MAALLRASARTVSKALGDQTRGYKVAVLGAAGGIGQPCGLLMKMVRAAIFLRFYLAETLRGQMSNPPRSGGPDADRPPFPPPQNPLVTEPPCTIAGTPGVAADVSTSTPAPRSRYEPDNPTEAGPAQTSLAGAARPG